MLRARARRDRWGSPRHRSDPKHPFYRQDMVFTGALASMTRAHAWERVAEVGARPAPGVTQHANILVIGFQDASKLRPSEELPAKARRAPSRGG